MNQQFAPSAQNQMPLPQQNSQVANNMPTPKKNFSLSNLIILTLIVIVILIAAFIGYMIFTNNNATINNNSTTSTTTNIPPAPTYITSWLKLDNSIPIPSDTTGTNGRIPLGTNGTADSNGPAQPTVIKDGDTYKMWYSGDSINSSDAIVTTIMYATSSDGLTWTKNNNSIPTPSDTTSTDGQIPLGTAGSGDSQKVSMPTVLIGSDGLYRMWYGGFDGTNWRIFYATSSNGLNWTKKNNSILDPSDTTGTDGRIPLGTNGSADQKDASAPSVIWDSTDNLYKMWYSTVQPGYILMATSPDGLTWTKINNQIPNTSNTLSTDGRVAIGVIGTNDDTAVRNPSVIQFGGLYQMWYVAVNTNPQGAQGQLIDYATSPDGLTWTKYDNSLTSNGKISNGLITGGNIYFGQAGNGDEVALGGVSVMQDGDKLRMFYHANTYNSTRTKTQLTGIYSAIQYP